MKKEYTNGDVTVIWKPDVCIHSKICWTQLNAVFNPANKPWINMQGANTNEIIEQVKKCPSGALSYRMNNEAEPIKETRIENLIIVTKGGPLLVHGSITIQDHEGNFCQKDNVTAFCRCGQSKNKPFCDGSHKAVEFE
ncbi:MAG TPA: (4Fe-4S)-binding protein [Saprospiraceae bacterium]|nr:(4Fe-4S)-binding protein [Saprospiraceae bacterium]